MESRSLACTVLAVVLVASCARGPRSKAAIDVDIPLESVRRALELVILEDEPGMFAVFDARGDSGKYVQVMLDEDGLLHIDIPITTTDAWHGQEKILVWHPTDAPPHIDGTVTEELAITDATSVREFFAARNLALRTRYRVAYDQGGKPAAKYTSFDIALPPDAAIVSEVVVGLFREAYRLPATTRFDIAVAQGDETIAHRSHGPLPRSVPAAERRRTEE